MRFSDVLTGVATGVPVMIVVGPIAVLLIEQGLTRGMRGAAPAALGVAGADLAFSTGAAVAGAAAARVLAPVETVVRLGAVAVLGYLALHLWRSARCDLAAAHGGPEQPPGEVRPSGATDVVEPLVNQRGAVQSPVGGVGGHEVVGPEVVEPEFVGTVQRPDRDELASPAGLAAGFFLVTAVNPITIVVFTSIVVGGAGGVGTVGWVVGMVLASLLVNTGFVSVGAGLGAVLDDMATARLRMAGAGLIVGLATWFALT